MIAERVINRALYRIKAASVINPPNTEMTSESLQSLRELITGLASEGISLGITIPGSPSDELGNPDWSDSFLQAALAINIAAMFGKDVPGTVEKEYQDGLSNAISRANLVAEPFYPGNLPLGAGNRTGPNSVKFFPEPDPLTDENDLPLLDG